MDYRSTYMCEIMTKRSRNDVNKAVMDRFVAEYGNEVDMRRSEQPKEYVAYTDGSNNNRHPQRPAGAAYVILGKDGQCLHYASKGFLGKTNNYVEMMAIISAVGWVPKGARITVYSDSKYAIKAFSGHYRPKANINLIERYQQVSEGKEVKFKWVKGHNGNYWNEYCDDMARKEYENIKATL